MKRIFIALTLVLILFLASCVFLYLNGKDRAEENSLNDSLVGQPYREIVNPSGFVNTGGNAVTISELGHGKVMLLEFMRYDCPNCIRSFPELVRWNEMYRDDGLVMLGIHTPQFAYEREQQNVERALQAAGITFPIVLDNDYATWLAYGNHYWPRTFLIDQDGIIVMDHIGAGDYEMIESRIRHELGIE